MKKNLYFILLAAFIIIILSRYTYSLAHQQFTPDELEHIHTARSINLGQKIYLDFFEHHMPFHYLLLAPLHHYYGDTEIYLLKSRWITGLFMVLILAATFFTARKFSSKNDALTAVFLLTISYIFVEKTVEIRPDIIMIFFLMAGFLFMLHNFRDSRFSPRLISGFFMGLALWTSVKGGLGIAGILTSVLIYLLIWGTLRKILDIFIPWVCGFLSVLTAGSLVAYKMGILNGLIQYNFVNNATWEYSFSFYRSFHNIILNDPVVTALFITSWLFLTRNNGRVSQPYRFILMATITIITLEIIFIIPNPYLQNFLLLLPFLSIIAAINLNVIMRQSLNSRIHQTSYLFLWIWLIISSLFSVFSLLCDKNINTNLISTYNYLHLAVILMSVLILVLLKLNRKVVFAVIIPLLIWPVFHLTKEECGYNEQLEKIQYVQQVAGKDGTVLDSWSGYGVFNDHAIFYPFFHIGIQQQFKKQLQIAVREVLDTNPPEVIIVPSSYMKTGLGVLETVESCYRWESDTNIWILKTEDEKMFDVENIYNKPLKKRISRTLRQE